MKDETTLHTFDECSGVVLASTSPVVLTMPGHVQVKIEEYERLKRLDDNITRKIFCKMEDIEIMKRNGISQYLIAEAQKEFIDLESLYK
jgi:hypothetical protein